MPGKVLRQGDASNAKSQDLTAKPSSSQQSFSSVSSASAGSSNRESELKNAAASSLSSSGPKASSSSAASSLAALNLNDSDNREPKHVASSSTTHQNPIYNNPYAQTAARDADEDQSRLDKFSRILSQNPVNLGNAIER